MWVTYFENLPHKNSLFQSYTEFLRQVEVNGELTYVINGAVFELEESPILKIYRSLEHGFICYCSKESSEVKELSESFSNSIVSTSAKIPIQINSGTILQNSEYSDAGYPRLDSGLNLLLRELSESLIKSGIHVKKFQLCADEKALIEIESGSIADLISDVEFVRFFCINFFKSNNHSFRSVSKRSSELFEFSLNLNRKIKAVEKKKISKFENIVFTDNRIDLKNIFSNAPVFREVMGVIYNLSP